VYHFRGTDFNEFDAGSPAFSYDQFNERVFTVRRKKGMIGRATFSHDGSRLHGTTKPLHLPQILSRFAATAGSAAEPANLSASW
jgi:hypothetical protein